jgi:hypothetical protein
MMYDWKTFTFGTGMHDNREDGMCLMEAVAYVAGEDHSDHPACASPVISSFLRGWNDRIKDDSRRTELLSEFVWRLPGTATADKDIEDRRAWMALDWLIRVHTPAFLRAAGLDSHTSAMSSLPEVGVDTVEDVTPVVAAARGAARDAAGDAPRGAAWDAARDAAGDAARGAALVAAGAAAGDAAWSAARGAAWAAAGDAAGDAAWAAAWAASRDALSQTVHTLQDSARDLVDRMIRLTEVHEPEFVEQGEVSHP